jgi:hypothetical protein
VERPATSPLALKIDLVRAHVRGIPAADGKLRISISAPEALLRGADILIDEKPASIEVHDSYPRPSLFGGAECAPTASPRGAFWLSEVVFDVSISAPATVTTQIHVMDPR